MNAPLTGLSALVTGGTRGIGAAIARRLLDDGARVIVTGTTSSARCPEGAELVAVDFTDRLATADFAAQLTSRDIGILVNNAGINRVAPFGDIDLRDYDAIQDVNVRAPLALCRAVLPGMRRARWGRIVNVASVFGVVSRAYRASYSASKQALIGITNALAVEVAAEGILVNCVSPGFIDTELTRRVLREDGIRSVVAQVPMSRLGRPEEVASLVAWLVGPENTFLTAQNIIIDGGFTSV